MNEPDSRKPVTRLDAYLDGVLEDPDRRQMQDAVSNDPALSREASLQADIDGAIDRLFHVEPPSHAAIAAMLPPAGGTTSKSSLQPRGWWAAGGLAAAAVLAWIMFGWRLEEADNHMPFFATRPLVDVYRETVANGFEPAYVCEEPDRFAATFKRRQGQPLALLPMPAGSRMLGLSYPGGLSRNTTAMLCRVNGEPVMVFVDRLGSDSPQEKKVGTANVFRSERAGLVFYEVTPFDSPQVGKFLVRRAG